MLTKGTQITCQLTKKTITVEKKLGDGGQGEVYLVLDGLQKYALKWYYSDQATEEQRQVIIQLVNRGAPAPPEIGQRFVWPVDLVSSPNSSQFGYIMPLVDMSTYAELGEVMGGRKPQPSLAKMCTISYNLVESYRALHLAGLCYRDISRGNMMFNPNTGDVLICDNDNVGVAAESKSQVIGTFEFMAPEVLMGTAVPSTKTDLHSLAVLLFYFWMWHHPMHGDLECAVRSWDLPAKKKMYGQEPVFIFDPQDTRNRPNEPEYVTVRKRWDICPASLKNLFIKAFTVGLKDPFQRVTEGEWQQAFLQLETTVLACGSCGAENLWDKERPQLICWHCGKPVKIPSRLEIKTTSGPFSVFLTPTQEIYEYHLKPAGGKTSGQTLVGKMVQNPNNPNQWGIRNLTQSSWTLTMADGTVKDVPPQKASPLALGGTLQLEDGIKASFI